ncbi:MAG: hypothetical protein Q9187_005218 [Circinaria calcarea]
MSYSASSSSTVRSMNSSSSSTLFDQLPAYPEPTYNGNVESRTSRRHALSTPATFTDFNEKMGYKHVGDGYRGAGVAYGNLTSTSASPKILAAASAKFNGEDTGNLKGGHGHTNYGHSDRGSVTEHVNFTSAHPSPASTFTLVNNHNVFPAASKLNNYDRYNDQYNGKKQAKYSTKKSSRSCSNAFDFSYRNAYTTATGTGNGIFSGGASGRVKLGTPTSGPAACQLM